MSLFELCEYCDKIAETSCRCDSTPRFTCTEHVINHMELPGNHSFKAISAVLSDEEASVLRRAALKYQNQSVCEVVSARNSEIEKFLLQIKKAEQECLASIRRIFKGELPKKIQEMCSMKAIPLNSEDPLVTSLVSLKQNSMMSETDVLDQLVSSSSCEQEDSQTYPLQGETDRYQLVPSSSDFVPSMPTHQLNYQYTNSNTMYYYPSIGMVYNENTQEWSDSDDFFRQKHDPYNIFVEDKQNGGWIDLVKYKELLYKSNNPMYISNERDFDEDDHYF